ncbi:MAG TPA: NAD+ synthase [Acidisarcina sp.]
MKIALAQINPTVGDFDGNTRKIIEFARRAESAGAELAVFPELAICGYPPADLLEKPSFLSRAARAVEEIAAASAHSPTAILCGTVTPAPASTGRHAFNTAVLMRGGRVVFTQSKMLLPFYDVFDEQRYFAPAASQHLFHFGEDQLAITICEDAWNDKSFWETRRYSTDPVEELMHSVVGATSAVHAGAGYTGASPVESAGTPVVLNIACSPYWRGKRSVRFDMLSAIARRHGVPVLMVNQVGGNDSLIFDGTSLAIGSDGRVIALANSFEEDLVLIDTQTMVGDIHAMEDDEDAAIYQALMLGTRDYVRKCGFSRVLIGLSGGIDSALVAAIAADALGPENVTGITLPSQYSSAGSIDDSATLAAALGIRIETMSIHSLFTEYNRALGPLFSGREPDITEENIQSRIRGNLLMALSNKFGSLVLTTGNKSEMSVGYCTLYGDMVGALAVIGDVFKTRVYSLARYRNRDGEVIPRAILEKPPSAELRPEQMDTDSLPAYEVLDPILEAYVEHYETPEAIASQNGFDLELVRSVVKLVERSEYKRQQAAIVLKVTEKAFGMGRRFPIAVKVEV